MKQALQRIHATLDQLETLKQSTTEPSTVTDRPISFQILPVAPKVDLPSPSPESERPQSLQLPQFSTSSIEPSPTTTTQVERSPSAPIVDLERIAQRIQALYYEGPIVDAWIDSYPTAPESDDEIEEIVFERPDLSLSSNLDRSLSPTSYRVCGLDASGEQWSYPCPLDQLLELSVAIARYHKIQELLAQKRQLESQIESNAIGENINNS
ncbi:MAG: hypothetical protein N4J56_005940 [Chroococcidiopsis sp. SAG 2025]|uniref:hypothetical protein n=1 Tax=Chroococcidiopsis sp. SAG 2025 TaxID=171389 RepID=UPI0029373170|nr:hypothetical protein [Chroococcidiopsis sp. SAG 2025]MDV2996286.1 hypothetical protein [Chroococcidiopsis sp. SAG 2025]